MTAGPSHQSRVNADQQPFLLESAGWSQFPRLVPAKQSGSSLAPRASSWPVPALLLENRQEMFQLRLHNVRLVSCHFSFINSVCSKLYSYENNKTKAKSPGIFTLSHVVRSVYAVAQGRLRLVPQDVRNLDKIGQINNYMYSKIEGEVIQVSKYRQRLNNILLQFSPIATPLATTLCELRLTVVLQAWAPLHRLRADRPAQPRASRGTPQSTGGPGGV